MHSEQVSYPLVASTQLTPQIVQRQQARGGSMSKSSSTQSPTQSLCPQMEHRSGAESSIAAVLSRALSPSLGLIVLALVAIALGEVVFEPPFNFVVVQVNATICGVANQ